MNYHKIMRLNWLDIYYLRDDKKGFMYAMVCRVKGSYSKTWFLYIV